jgi:hypothetical protein
MARFDCKRRRFNIELEFYTPTVGFTFILKHLPPFRIPILRNIVLREVSVRRRDSFLQPSLHSGERNNRTCLVSRSAAPIEIGSSNQPPATNHITRSQGLAQTGQAHCLCVHHPTVCSRGKWVLSHTS